MKHFFLVLIGILPFLAHGQQFRKQSTSPGQTLIGFSNSPIRHQYIFSAAELQNPTGGVVDNLYFRKNTGGGGTYTFTNLVIRLGFVSFTDFSQNGNQFFENLTPVLAAGTFNVTLSSASGYFQIPVANNFFLPANTSLVVEMEHDGVSPTMTTILFGSVANKVLHGVSPDFTSPVVSNVWPDFGIDITNTNAIPVNNQCTGGLVKLVGTSCSPILGTTVGALQETGFGPLSCGAFTSSAAKDVWYSFTALGANDIIGVQGLGGFDPVVNVYSGSCGALSYLGCADATGSSGLETFTTSFTPNQTYYVRIYGYNGVDGTFAFCVQTQQQIVAANDDCPSATPVSVSSAVPSTVYNTLGATQTLTPTTCSGLLSNQADDVWFSFVAQTAFDTVIVDPLEFFNPVVELYSGACSGLLPLSCSNNPSNLQATEKISIGSLVPGQTYRVRVYGFNGDEGYFAFGVRRNAQLTNDACASAVLLTPSGSCVPTSGTNTGATGSANLPISICQPVNQASTTANDVWYRFVATSANNRVSVTPVGTFDPIVEVFSGNCNSLVSLGCRDSPAASTTEVFENGSLVVGQTYYVRVYGWGASTGDFTVCVTTPSGIANDECTGATILTVGTTCTPVQGNTATATGSGQLSCSGTVADDDVWYQFVPPVAGPYVFRLSGSSGFDGAMQIYVGSCGLLSQVACVDRANVGLQEDTVLSLTTSNVVYIRVYHAEVGSGTGQFSLCVNRVLTPANNECAGATSLIIGTNGNCTPQAFTTYGATQSLPPFLCDNSTGLSANDVWFRIVPTANSVRIQVASVGISDPVVQAYTGSCTALTSLDCQDIGLPGQNEELVLSNLVIGTPVFIRVYDFGSIRRFGDYTICVTSLTCTTPVGVLSLGTGRLVSNGGTSTTITGIPGSVDQIDWSFSTDQGQTWQTGPSTTALLDTFILRTATNSVFQLRASVRAGGCAATFTNTASIQVDCHATLTNVNTASTGNYIRRIQLGTFSNFSTPSALQLGYQDFRNQSISLCQGSTTALIITPNLSSQTYRAAWVDFDNDGIFNSTNELVVAPTLSSLPTTHFLNIPSTLSPGNRILRIVNFIAGAGVVSNDPCSGGPFDSGEIEEYTLSIGALPSPANAGQDQTTCATSVQLSAVPPVVGNGLWIVTAGSGILANPNSPNTTVSNLGSGTNTFTWSVVTTCGNSSDQVSVQVTPSQQAQAGSDQSVCSPNAVLAGNQPTGNTSGVWSLFSGSGQVSNPTSPNSAVVNLGIGVNRFIWTLSVPGCSPSRDTVTITRDAPPSNATAGPDQSVCGTSTQLAGNVPQVGTGIWTRVSGSGQITNPGLANSPVTGLGSGASIFRWTISNGNCPTSFSEVTINATPVVQAQAGPDQTLCSDQASLQAANPSPSNGSWSLFSGLAIIDNPGAASTLVTNLGSGINVFIWTVNNGGCPQSHDTVRITRLVAQTASAGTDQSICGGQATLQGNAASSGTGTWTLVSGSGQIQQASNPNTLVTGLGTGPNVFRWTLTSAPCPASSDEVTITNLGNATIASAGPDQTLCSPQATLAGNVAVFGAGQWSLISGSGTVANPASPTSAISNLGVGLNVFRWTITNGNCPSNFDDVTLTRVANPTIANAGADQNICTGSATLQANTVGSGTGQWTLVSGSGQIQNPASAQTVVSGLGSGANVFRWTIQNAPCPASTDEVTITTTLNAVTANAGPDQVLCGATAQLVGNNPGSGTGTWILVSGSGQFSNAGQGSTEVTNLGVGINIFRWTVATGACPPSQDEVSIERVAPQAAANAGPDQNICTGTATLSATQPGSGSGVWTLVSGTGTIQNPNSPVTQVSGLGNGANTFRWTVQDLPCPSTQDEITITTTLTALSANAGTDQSVCGAVGNLIGNSAGAGIGQWTLVSGSGSITNPAGNQTSVTNLGPGPNVFRWSITTGACPASSDEVTLTSVPSPSVANAGTDQSLCGSAATLAGNAPNQGTGTWTLVSGSGQIANPANPASPVVGLGNGANVFRWTISNSPCPPSSDEVTLNATPASITATAGADRTVCGSATFLGATAPVSGLGIWTLVSGGGQIAQPGNPVSEVTQLNPGANVFAWTVTEGNCTASDLVTITREINSLNLGPDTLVCIGTSFTLTAGSGFSSYQWFDNSTSQTLTVGSSGTYWVQVQSANNCTYRDSVRVTFIVCTGAEPLVVQEGDGLLYPNPASGSAWWQWQGEENLPVRLRLIDGLGRETWAREFLTDRNPVLVPLSGQPSGVYWVEWDLNGKRSRKALLVR